MSTWRDLTRNQVLRCPNVGANCSGYSVRIEFRPDGITTKCGECGYSKTEPGDPDISHPRDIPLPGRFK